MVSSRPRTHQQQARFQCPLSLHQRTRAQARSGGVETCRLPPCLVYPVSIGISLLDASSISLLMSASMAPQCAVNWNRRFGTHWLVRRSWPVSRCSLGRLCELHSVLHPAVQHVSRLPVQLNPHGLIAFPDPRFAAPPERLPRPPPTQGLSTNVHGAQRCSATVCDVIYV